MKAGNLFIFIGLYLFIILVPSGCGKKESIEGKITLTWWGYAYPVYNQFRSEQSKKFERFHPDVTVRYVPVSGRGFHSKLMTAMAGGQAPDIFFLQSVNDFAKRGALLDLSSYMEEDKEYFSNFYSLPLEAAKFQEKFYAIPINFGVTLLFYNRKLFDECGVDYPDENWTLQDMLGAAIKLTKKDARGKLIQFGLIPGDIWYYIWQNGGDLWNADKTECIINSPETIEAVQFYKDLRNKYQVSPSLIDYKQQGAKEMFANNKAAMMMGDSWLMAAFSIRKYGELDWYIAHPPSGKRRVTLFSCNWLGVWSKTKHPRSAYELAKYMSGVENTKFLISLGDTMPMRKKGEDVGYFLTDPNRPKGCAEICLEVAEYATVSRLHLQNPRVPFSQMKEILKQNFEAFTVVGNVTAEKTLQNIANKLNAMIKD